MRILEINSVYKEGSTGKIVACICDELIVHGYEVVACYGNGKPYYDDHSIKVCSALEHNFNALLGRVAGIPFGGFYFSNRRVEKVIRSFNPDIVHVHCVNGYMINVYSLLKYLAKNRFKTILTLHAEIFHTAGCEHAFDCNKWKSQCRNCEYYRQSVGSWFFDRSKTSWQKMFDALNTFNVNDLKVTAVSPWLAGRVKQSTIMKRYQVDCVLNGLDTSIFHYKDNVGMIDRRGYEKTVLFVTPYFGLEDNDIKGGRYIPALSRALPNYKFVIVASKQSESIEGLSRNIQIWGRAKNQEELAQLYSEADVTIMLSRRETFSMVTAESLCCGTPVVGFKAGGPESIAIKDYCGFVEYGDIPTLVTCLESLLKQKFEKKKISNLAISSFGAETMYRDYYSIYKTFLK